MQEIQKTFQGQPVRAFQIDGAAWFVLADVCRALGIKNPRQVASRLDDDEKAAVNTLTLNKGNAVTQNDGIRGNPNMTIISESGLYALILRSDKPAAKPFRKWVTSEVLPSIRQTRSYTAGEGIDAGQGVPLVSTRAIAQATGLQPRSVRKRAQRHALQPVGLSSSPVSRPAYLYPLPEVARVFQAPDGSTFAVYSGPVFPYAAIPFQPLAHALPSASHPEDPRALARQMLATAEELTRAARALLK